MDQRGDQILQAALDAGAVTPEQAQLWVNTYEIPLWLRRTTWTAAPVLRASRNRTQ